MILVTWAFAGQGRLARAPGGRRRSSLATVERPRTAQRRPSMPPPTDGRRPRRAPSEPQLPTTSHDGERANQPRTRMPRCTPTGLRHAVGAVDPERATTADPLATCRISQLVGPVWALTWVNGWIVARPSGRFHRDSPLFLARSGAVAGRPGSTHPTDPRTLDRRGPEPRQGRHLHRGHLPGADRKRTSNDGHLQEPCDLSPSPDRRPEHRRRPPTGRLGPHQAPCPLGLT